MSTAVMSKPIVMRPWEDFDTILQHAEHARAMNDSQRARTLYARLVELNPNDPRGWTGLAENAVSTDEAIISWAYTLALAPNSLEARFQLESFIAERIDKSGITDAAVLVALARTIAQVGEKPGAYRLVTHATELDPTNPEAWLWRAGLTEDKNETIQCLRHVLAVNPNHAQAQAGLQWALAQSHTPPVLKSPADSTRAQESFEQGQTALQHGALTDAYQSFVKATQLDPTNQAAWFWRASTAPDLEESLACMEQTLRLNPQHAGAKDALWYLRVKKYRESFAIRTSPPLALDDPNDQETLLQPKSTRAPRKISLRVILIAALIAILILAIVFLFVILR